MMWASPPYWGCPKCGGSEAWILTDGAGIMCSDSDCYAIFASVDEWVAGREVTHTPPARTALVSADERVAAGDPGVEP
jgi:benzoyl-CoA reductase/2-hydroxyglutaryl-CoA dehydratase subunit BcrC/BadD/HgdB